MASPASLATLGSARPNPFAGLESTPLAATNRRIHVISRISFHNFNKTRQWSHSPRRICRCMVATNLVEEKGISSSLASTFKGSGSSGSKDNDADLVLKPAPKPVLKVRSNGPIDQIASDNRPDTITVNDRDNVIESLGVVLEKAEKLETATPRKLASRDTHTRDSGKSYGGSKSTRTVEATPSTRKSKTLKSVWRKGNPVANVQRVVKEIPKVEKVKEEDHRASSLVGGPKKSQAQLLTPLKPQIPSPCKVAPRLQTKPAAAPPPSPPSQPLLKEPNIVKGRKPILIDKFAVKKPIVDPIAAEAVLAPTKPVKGPLSSKAKDERRKKSNALGGLRKRLVDDVEMPDASELDVPIPGVAGARKGRKWSKASRKAARLQAAKAAAPVKVEILEVGEDGMLTEELAYNLAVSEADILGYLFSKGVKPDTAQILDKDMVKMICKEYGVEVIEVEPIKVEQMARKKEVLDEEDLDMLVSRPPVITIMGHVDHGKTTLLDYIRKTKVAASEAGGITQGIGAYKVPVLVDGRLQPCVFLDTPGHEAFGAMRARGARVTDIAIIVVAADDGVRPQTNEAIAHAKAAGVPIIIAINKIDKDGASPARVMQELSSVGLMPEVWGGDIPMIQISALKGENVDELLETVMLVAELQELKANPHRNAKGTVIEAGLDKSKGPVATLIVQNGTIRRGDIVVCGEAFGKRQLKAISILCAGVIL